MANRDRSVEVDSPEPTTLELVRRFAPPAVLAVAALLFVVQNTDDTRFNFLTVEFTAPLWTMLVVFAAVGALVLWFLARRRRRSRASRV